MVPDSENSKTPALVRFSQNEWCKIRIHGMPCGYKWNGADFKFKGLANLCLATIFSIGLRSGKRGRYVGWGCILNCFMLSSLHCFYAFS